jgi:hypothetical protein
MIKKISMAISLLLMASVMFADKDELILFQTHTLNIMDFLDHEQDKESVKKIEYRPQSIKMKKPSAGKIDKDFKPAFIPTRYDFSCKTAYGDFKVLVFEETENSFKVSFSSENPIQMYQLTDTATKNTTKQESLNDKLDYSLEVSKKFEPKYVLILSMFKDDFLSQNIIPLYKKETTKIK